MKWVNDTHGTELQERLMFQGGPSTVPPQWCSDSGHDAWMLQLKLLVMW